MWLSIFIYISVILIASGTVILDTQPSKICRGTTHDFQCTTSHHSGYLEWRFNFQNGQPTVKYTFENNPIENDPRQLANSITVTLIRVNQIGGIQEYTSIAHIPRITNQMIIECGEPIRDYEQYTVEIEDPPTFKGIIIMPYFYDDKKCTLIWNRPGRCCSQYKIYIKSENYATIVNYTFESQITFPIKYEITNISLFCLDLIGMLGTGKKVRVNPVIAFESINVSAWCLNETTMRYEISWTFKKSTILWKPSITKTEVTCHLSSNKTITAITGASSAYCDTIGVIRVEINVTNEAGFSEATQQTKFTNYTTECTQEKQIPVGYILFGIILAVIVILYCVIREVFGRRIKRIISKIFALNEKTQISKEIKIV